MARRTKFIGFWTHADLNAQVRARAKRESRSLSAMIELLLRQALQSGR